MPDGQPLRPADPAGLGAYRLEARLGEGNQGVVYLGRDASGDKVAIKLLHARMAADPGARDRFVRELSVAKKVARFCTAQILDADLAGDHPYIVSEYVEGRSLGSHIAADGPRTGGALERLAIGTLTALAAIHQAGIVHRDFNPHNVLLGPDGPRVIDFGIARALGAATNNETNSVGTPAYMAPEQVAGDEIGSPADMFAWGGTILYAATGRPPFGNESVSAVMDRIVASEPDIAALPEPLRSVVAGCLAKDPARRPTARQAQARLLGHDVADAPPAPAPAAGTPAPPPATADAGGTDSTAGAAGAGGTGRTNGARGAVAWPPVPVASARTPGPHAGSGATDMDAGRDAHRTIRDGRRVRVPRARWAIIAGAAAVVAAAVAVPLWPGGGDAATTSPRGTRPASAPDTPAPSTATSAPQTRGIVRSVAPKTRKPTATPAKGCRDYSRTYDVPKTGKVRLKVSVCRGGYTGTAVTADTVPNDGWGVCLQLRGHLVGDDDYFVSTEIMSSAAGASHGFDNGPKVRFGPETTRSEDWVMVSAGRCKGSGATWQSRDRLAAG